MSAAAGDFDTLKMSTFTLVKGDLFTNSFTLDALETELNLERASYDVLLRCIMDGSLASAY